VRDEGLPAQTSRNGEHIRTGTCVGYGVGSIGTGMFSAVPGLLLLYFLTDTLGVAAGVAGVAVFVPKIWDMITDPVMGTISDRTVSRWGRRRPYLLAGAVTLPVFFALMFSVPDMGGSTFVFLYVTAMFLLAATAFTVFVVPYVSMPAEMTTDYHERTRIMSYRVAFMSVGILAAGAAAPAIVELAGEGRGAYALMGVVLGVACGASMLTAFVATRRAAFKVKAEVQPPVRQQLRIAFRNRPFVVLVCSMLIQLLGVATILAAVPFYADYILEGSGFTVTIMFVCLMLPAVIAMPGWLWVSKRIGKTRSFMVSVAVFGVCTPLLLVGGPDTRPIVYAIVVVMGLAYGGTQLFPFSMLPDTIELDASRSGMRREGVFTGVLTASEKVGMAAGALVAGSVLDYFGFVESVAGETVAQPDRALTGILVAFCIVPAIFFFLSLPVLSRYDLTEQRLRRLVAEGSEGQGSEALGHTGAESVAQES
jgi:GPH family glycoside/pentoside/hexuronide:cation symporter